MMGVRHAARPGPATAPTGWATHARRALAGLLLGFVALLMPHPAAAAPAPGPGAPASAVAGHTSPPVATASRGARLSVGPVTDDRAEGDTHSVTSAGVVLHATDHARAAPPAVLAGAVLTAPPTGTSVALSRSPQAPAGGPAHGTSGRSPPASETS